MAVLAGIVHAIATCAPLVAFSEHLHWNAAIRVYAKIVLGVPGIWDVSITANKSTIILLIAIGCSCPAVRIPSVTLASSLCQSRTCEDEQNKYINISRAGDERITEAFDRFGLLDWFWLLIIEHKLLVVYLF